MRWCWEWTGIGPNAIEAGFLDRASIDRLKRRHEQQEPKLEDFLK